MLLMTIARPRFEVKHAQLDFFRLAAEPPAAAAGTVFLGDLRIFSENLA